MAMIFGLLGRGFGRLGAAKGKVSAGGGGGGGGTTGTPIGLLLALTHAS